MHDGVVFAVGRRVDEAVCAGRGEQGAEEGLGVEDEDGGAWEERGEGVRVGGNLAVVPGPE